MPGDSPTAPSYDAAFFAAQMEGSRVAARVVLGHLRRYVAFRSVLDIGCGTGAWGVEAGTLGASRLLGVDGAHVPAAARLLPPEQFLEHDLNTPLDVPGQFDLVICQEVAEHLPIGGAAGFIGSLCRAARRAVLFSAALPYQGGTAHVAETWLEFWSALFEAHGFVGADVLRPLIWREQRVPWWYRQNSVLFIPRRRLWRHPRLWGSGPPVSLVHPEGYLWAVHRPRVGDPARYGGDVASWARPAADMLTDPRPFKSDG